MQFANSHDPDLGSSPGLVLEGTNLLCGGTGNCQIFVFRRVNDRFSLLAVRCSTNLECHTLAAPTPG